MPGTPSPNPSRKKVPTPLSQRRKRNLEDATPQHAVSRSRAGRKPSKTWRKHITFPGLLAESVHKRCVELLYESFSPYGVELVCYDLRKRFPHVITQRLSNDLRPIQDGVDKQIVAHYEPGKPRDKGLLLRIVHGEVPPLPPEYLRHLECSVGEDHIKFPGRLRGCIETRWRELGYGGISSYVTALIRYDLALGGPHNDFNGTIRDPKILAELDEMTAATFAEGKVERIRLIDFIEEALGRKLTMEEAMDEMKNLLNRLREIAVMR